MDRIEARETHFDNGTDLGGIANIRKEAVHAAAVALAFVECIDRNTNEGVVQNANG